MKAYPRFNYVTDLIYVYEFDLENVEFKQGVQEKYNIRYATGAMYKDKIPPNIGIFSDVSTAASSIQYIHTR